MSETRRLAAILAADVVGYSRLMGEDEAGTARAVREQREAAAPIVRGFGGRLVKTMGDGVLLEFPSVVAAVECAILMQKQMAERNAGVPEARRILYRIGVNLGDVLIDGEDILGDGVNIAARLESIAEPGGVRPDDHRRDIRRRAARAVFIAEPDQDRHLIDVALLSASQRRSISPPAARRSRKATSSQGHQSFSKRRAHARRSHARPRKRSSSSLPPIRLGASGPRSHAYDPSATFKSP